jgi:hypothetical protein
MEDDAIPSLPGLQPVVSGRSEGAADPLQFVDVQCLPGVLRGVPEDPGHEWGAPDVGAADADRQGAGEGEKVRGFLNEEKAERVTLKCPRCGYKRVPPRTIGTRYEICKPCHLMLEIIDAGSPRLKPYFDKIYIDQLRRP